MKACRYIQLPNLWCRRCIARECLGSNADRSVLVNQMLLQDWRHHGGYRCLVARLALHQYGKWRHSPERQYWLVMLVVDCVFKLLIMKPLAPGSMDMVVGETSRQRQQKAVKSTTACERWSQSLLSKLAEWEISDCGIVWSLQVDHDDSPALYHHLQFDDLDFEFFTWDILPRRKDDFRDMLCGSGSR